MNHNNHNITLKMSPFLYNLMQDAPDTLGI